jgi:DNA N-6-adenine-methyltransferase (Dam)
MTHQSMVTMTSNSLAPMRTGETTYQWQAKMDGLIDYAAKMQDWDLLERAIDGKIEDQARFVEWWDENVRRPGKPSGSDVINDVLGFLPKKDAEASTGITQQQVSSWRKALRDKLQYRQKQLDSAYRKARLIPPQDNRAEGTGENELFTPEEFITAARAVMGNIDLDPASHQAAQQTVQADAFYTRQDDGLSKAWHGNVWLNPPCSQPLLGQFVEKLVTEVTSGGVAQAIMLTRNNTDTKWFHQALAVADLICLYRGRIKFYDINEEEAAATRGQVFFYFGERKEEFLEVFREFGFIVQPA